MQRININDFYTVSISIKGHNIVMLIKIQKCEKDETQSLFFQFEATNSLTCFLINHCHHNKFQHTFIILFYI